MRLHLRQDPWSRFARLTFSALLLLAWTGGPALAQAAQAGGDDEKAVRVMRQLLAMAEEQIEKPNADPSDVIAKSAELGHDPDKLFAFVRDGIAFEPYAGVLRGPRGALAARSANAWDAALLLKAMLEAGGSEARLVKGTLPPEQAAARVQKFLTADPLAGPLGEMLQRTGDDATLAAFAQQSGIDKAKFQAAVDEARKQQEAFERDAEKGTDEALAYLRAEVSRSKAELGKSHEQWTSELGARAADHAWVQVKKGGAWVDLDPAAGEAGKAVAAGTPVDAAKLDNRHVVTLTLNYVTAKDDKPDEQSLLAVRLYADEAVAAPVAFSIRPADELPPPSKMMSMTRPELEKLVAGVEKFQAILRAGTERYSSRVFDTKGNVFEVSADGRVKGASQLGSAAGGLFGGALGGGGGDEKPANNFRALVMAIKVEAPGVAPRTQTRTLYTAQDLARKPVPSPMLDWEMMIQPHVIPATLASYQSLKHKVDTLRPAMAAVSGKASPGQALDGAITNPPAPFSQFLTEFAMVRQAALARSLKSQPGAAAVLWDAPQIVIAEQRLCGCAHNPLGGKSRVDIVENSLALVPRTPAGAPAAVEMAMRQGVYDTVSENLFVILGAGGEPMRSAIALLDKARTDRVPLVQVAGGAKTVLSPEDADWVAKAEASRIVLAPQAGETAAWWSIDPRTGSVVGRTSGGYGESMVENATLQQIAGGVMCFLAVGKDQYSAQQDAKAPGGKPVDSKSILMKAFVCSVAMGTGLVSAWLGAGPFAMGILFYLNLALSGSLLFF